MSNRPNLIFDLDGTLVDSAPVLVGIVNEMLAERRSARQVTVADARPFLSYGAPALLSELLGPQCGDLASEVTDFRRRYAERPTSVQHLFPGVLDGLHELYRLGFTMAVCSNKPQNLCDKVLRDVGLTGMFEVIVGSAPSLRQKPDPELMNITLHHLRSDPSNAVLIGDSEVDRDAALRSGVEFLFVDYGYCCPDHDMSGTLRFARFHDLVAWLKSRHTTVPPLRRVA
jgi:phosphoglycolate phosphatase